MGKAIGERKNLPQPPSLKEQGYFPARYFVAFMSFMAMVFNYVLRVNIGFTILAMVKPTNSSTKDYDVDPCNFGQLEEDQSYSGDFEWDEFMQNTISASFFWGYIWTQVPGGRLAEVIGPQKVFGGAIGITAFLTLFIPLAARQNPIPLIVIRVLMGLAEGCTFPVSIVIISSWAPPLERSVISSIVYAGSHMGTVITYPMAAALIESFSWKAVFYTQGALGLIFCVIWFATVTDSPTDFKWISNVEKEYIMSSLSHCKQRKAIPVPWKSIFTSLPVWSLMFAEFGHNWCFWFVMTDLPLYMKTMLKYDLNSNAWFSGLPFLSLSVCSLVLGFTLDKLRQKGVLSTIVVRKGATVLAHMTPAMCFVALSWAECNRKLTLALLYISVSALGAVYSGFAINHLDLAPNFAGTLDGISNGFGTIGSFLAPMTAGALTNKNQTFGQWEKIFYISAGMYVFDTLFFVIFGSCEEQEWNKPKNLQKSTSTKENSPNSPKADFDGVEKDINNLNSRDFADGIRKQEENDQYKENFVDLADEK